MTKFNLEIGQNVVAMTGKMKWPDSGNVTWIHDMWHEYMTCDMNKWHVTCDMSTWLVTCMHDMYKSVQLVN